VKEMRLLRHRQHRGWHAFARHDDLDDALPGRKSRSVSMNLTLQYDQVLFILEPTGIARRWRANDQVI